MLKVENLTKYRGEAKVLNKVGFTLKRGDIRGFLGSNGAGKTTTFEVIAGVEGYSDGTIHLGELNLKGLPVHIRARKGLAFLPQETSLFRGLLVRENLEVYLRGVQPRERGLEERVQAVLEELKLLDLVEREASTLSAGQGRAVEIARALVLSPNYLLLDEPFSDLDPRSVGKIKEILVSLRKEEEVGIMISDHRAKEALSITEHNYLIKDGEIIVEGGSEEIAETEEAQETYFARLD